MTICLRDQTGDKIFYKVRPSTKIGQVMKIHSERRGLPIESLRFLLDGDLKNPSHSILDLDIEDGDQIDVMLEQRGGCVASPVPATFGTLAADGAHFLASPGAAEKAPPLAARALAIRLGGDLNAAPLVALSPNLIGPRGRAALMQLLDEAYAARAPTDSQRHDLRLTLTRARLCRLVGNDAVARAAKFFAASVGPQDSCTFRTIKLRRVAASSITTGGGGSGAWVNFHVDYSRRTMQVALNSDEAYQGGRLVFATGQRGFVVPRRPAGSATVHCGNLAHGVTALARGVRYGLFFCDTPPPIENKKRLRTKGSDTAVTASLDLPPWSDVPMPPVMRPRFRHGLSFTYLAEAVLEEFAFFERALIYLEKASDDDLVLAAAAYAQFFSAALAEGSIAEGVPLELELAWRCHLLRPVRYRQDCAALASNLGRRRSEGDFLLDHCPGQSVFSDAPSASLTSSAASSDAAARGLHAPRYGRAPAAAAHPGRGHGRGGGLPPLPCTHKGRPGHAAGAEPGHRSGVAHAHAAPAPLRR